MRRVELATIGLALLGGACGDLVGIPGSGFYDGGATDTGRSSREGGSSGEGGEGGLPGNAAVSVSSGPTFYLACAVTRDGDVYCWGDGSTGMLGNGKSEQSATPVKVAGLPRVKRVSVGAVSVCALTEAGDVWCWGMDPAQLGDGDTTFAIKRPVKVVSLKEVISLSAGAGVYWGFTCAVKRDWTVWCWGEGDLLGRAGPAGAVAPDSPVPLEVPALTEAVAVSSGQNSACVLLKDGRVKCWGGYNVTGVPGMSPTPVLVQGLPDADPVADVSVGSDFACALTKGGAVWCWGGNESGQLGNGAYLDTPSPKPQPVSALSSGVVAISAGTGTAGGDVIASGAAAACALKRDGTVVCWGNGSDGALGNTNPTILRAGTGDHLEENLYSDFSNVPVSVQGLSNVVSISTGGVPCAVTRSGQVECWGLTATIARTPVPVGVYSGTAVSVSVGGLNDDSQFACAMSSNGTGNVSCWGADGYGQLGVGDGVKSVAGDLSQLRTVPSQLTGGLPVQAIAAGTAGPFGCAVANGDVLCWGYNASGQLGNGNGNTKSTSAPVPVMGLPSPTAMAVSAGADSACAVMMDGLVYCWGGNEFGQLGNGKVSTSPGGTATRVEGVSGATAVTVGAYVACALLTDTTVECWGYNVTGELGNGTFANSPVPTPVVGAGGYRLSGIAAISAGWYSVCAVTTDGAILCWGWDASGQLGDGSGTTYGRSAVPVQSFVDFGATRVAVGSEQACAIVLGAAWCWGFGLTGNGDRLYFGPPQSTPSTAVQVAGLESGVTDIAVGKNFACAVQHSDVYCWGYNTSGQLGCGGSSDSCAVDSFLPTRVAGFP